MARYWAVAALSLTECDYVPLDYAAYAREVQVYLDETERAARERKMQLDFRVERAPPRRPGREMVERY